ncbi:LuxR C-terminal-related transcriptional regulator [Streptomyces sp. NPDC090077]|uniref:helix-turn-helix transcriptional regulator n=1 Tax=Streptomyces sp. NPDC090077 TaxID=3365938 RepID=UPI003815DBC0
MTPPRPEADRGVRMRTVYLDSVRNDAVTSEYAEWLTGLGGEVRTVPVLPLRMLHFDRRTVIVGARPDRDRDDGGLTRQERELLKLLGSGLTDEAAGRQLGLSLRTVRRMMAELMKRLGAGSRFEAGLRAAQRGWI